jgi:hypothetical protein
MSKGQILGFILVIYLLFMAGLNAISAIAFAIAFTLTIVGLAIFSIMPDKKSR